MEGFLNVTFIHVLLCFDAAFELSLYSSYHALCVSLDTVIIDRS